MLGQWIKETDRGAIEAKADKLRNSGWLQQIGMLGRGAANIAESSEKLEEIERQLKLRLSKAKEVASSCKIDTSNAQSHEELMAELERLQIPPFDPNINYNHTYWKTYLENELNIALIRQAADRKNQLSELVTQIEDLQDQHYRLNRLRNRKKNRRLATEIEKRYLCPYDKCHRVYGSDVSLNLHIKLKHNGGNKTDREKLAEKICIAEENKQPPPPLTLNLPPGYLREYRRLYFQRDYQERAPSEGVVVSGRMESSSGLQQSDEQSQFSESD